MKENAYKIKNYSVDAIISIVLGGISLLAVIIAVIMSYSYDGRGPAIIGILGVGSLLFSGVGLKFARSSWKSVDGDINTKRIGWILNGVTLFITIFFYIIGWIFR